MQVQLRESRVSEGFSQRPGDVINVSDAEGERMIQAGQAVPYGPGGGSAETRGEDGDGKAVASRGRGRPATA